MTKKIPQGWVEAHISDIADVNPSNPVQVPSPETEVSFVPMATVETITGNMHPEEIRPWNKVRTGYTRFQEGDVLVAKITPSMENGKAAVARGLFNGLGAGSTEFHVLRPKNGVDSSIVLQFVLQESFRRTARANMKGTAGQLRVPSSFLEDSTFPLAPSEEQHRIVEAIESYFTRLDDAIATLERVQRNLKRYRASVLKAAVEGRLVPTEAELARAEGRDYEPASVLLERILEERRRRWIDDAAEKGRAKAEDKAKKAGKAWTVRVEEKALKTEREKAVKKYKEPTAPDTEGLPELPEAWCWLTIDATCFVTKLAGFEYTKFVTYDQDGDLPVLKAENAGLDGFYATEFSKVKSESVKHLTRSELFGDEVLIVFVGAGVGKVARVPTNQKYFLGPNIAMIRPDPSVADPAYLELYLRSGVGKQRALFFSKAVAQPSLSMGTVRKIPLALPPLQEQKRIVTRAENLLERMRHLEGELSDGLARASRLRQAILKWAFEGKLVDQDPTDEPASVLLERIKAEREATASSKTRRMKRAKT